MVILKDEKILESLREIINIGMGSGASVLNMMLNSHILLQVPHLKFVTSEELLNELSDDCEDKLTAVNMKYSGEISGEVQLIFTKTSAVQLVTALVNAEAAEEMVEELGAGVLVEMGNVVLNGVMGSISNTLQYTFTYSVPNYMEEAVENLIKIQKQEIEPTILLAKTHFEIQKFNINGDLILYFNGESVEKLTDSVSKIIEELS